MHLFLVVTVFHTNVLLRTCKDQAARIPACFATASLTPDVTSMAGLSLAVG